MSKSPKKASKRIKDSYLVEFLNFPGGHSESDHEHGLIENLKQFSIELGRDFCYVGSQYPPQVGGRDFALDLLFFNRALNALVAIELKIDAFQPEYLGKLEFYLEAPDRDVKKLHERSSIGVMLCATKDSEVVEYALSRSMSPALVAEYQTRMPDKQLLQAKLHKVYRLAQQKLNVPDIETQNLAGRRPKKPRKARAKWRCRLARSSSESAFIRPIHHAPEKLTAGIRGLRAVQPADHNRRRSPGFASNQLRRSARTADGFTTYLDQPKSSRRDPVPLHRGGFGLIY